MVVAQPLLRLRLELNNGRPESKRRHGGRMLDHLRNDFSVASRTDVRLVI
jgi:hypothetical protein